MGPSVLFQFSLRLGYIDSFGQVENCKEAGSQGWEVQRAAPTGGCIEVQVYCTSDLTYIFLLLQVVVILFGAGKVALSLVISVGAGDGSAGAGSDEQASFTR